MEGPASASSNPVHGSAPTTGQNMASQVDASNSDSGGSSSTKETSNRTKERDLWTDACKNGEEVLFYSINQARMRVLKNKIGVLELCRYVFCRQFYFLSTLGKLVACAEKSSSYLKSTRSKIERYLQLQLIERQLSLSQQQQPAELISLVPHTAGAAQTGLKGSQHSPEMFGVSNSSLMENAGQIMRATVNQSANGLDSVSAPISGETSGGTASGMNTMTTMNQMVAIFADYFSSYIDVRRKQADVFIVCAAIKIARTLRELLVQAIYSTIQQPNFLLGSQLRSQSHSTADQNGMSMSHIVGGSTSTSFARALSPSSFQRAQAHSTPVSAYNASGTVALSPPNASALAGYSYAATPATAGRTAQPSPSLPGSSAHPASMSMSLLGGLSLARDIISNTNSSNNIQSYGDVAKCLAEMLQFASSRLFTICNCTEVSPLLNARISALTSSVSNQLHDADIAYNPILLLSGMESPTSANAFNFARSYRSLALSMACVFNTWNDYDTVAQVNPASIKYFKDYNQQQQQHVEYDSGVIASAAPKKQDISELVIGDVLDSLVSYAPRIRGLMNCAWPLSFLVSLPASSLPTSNAAPAALANSPSRSRPGLPQSQSLGSSVVSTGNAVSDAALAARIVEKVTRRRWLAVMLT
jgi:hypothetical protein